MDCNDARLKMQALIDRELDEAEIPRVIDHMESCYGCRQEYIGFLRLQKKLESGEYPEPPREWFDQLEKSRPRRALSRLGLLLMIGSYAVLAVYGVIQAFADGNGEFLPKLLFGGIMGGALLLLAITISDRHRESRTDRYKDVKR
jgi:hypothetical protein